MIKKILIGLLGAIILLVIVGFFLPGKMEVSRSINVNAPAEYAFEEVNQLERWNNWSYWNQQDTTMKIAYGDRRMGAGAFYSWQSEDMGDGKLSITESTPFKSIKADLNFMEQGTAKAWYDFEPEGEATKVTMSFSTDFGLNPVGRWIGVLGMRGEMNKAFDHNLNKIKELAEAKPRFSVPITQEDVSGVSYIGLNYTMSPQDHQAVSAQMSKMYTELYSALGKSKIEPAGQPFSIYPKFSAESMDMICALPVPADAKLPKKYKLMQTDAGSAVKAIHKGDYATLEQTHNEINKFIEFRKLEITGAPWEVYVTDPDQEPDKSKWVTEVYYPVKK
jgi:effector-binding domain-containing protein